MKVVIFACDMGRTNGGKGQYASSLLLHLIPILHAEEHKVTVIIPKDAFLAFSHGKANVLRLPVTKNTGTWRVVWEQIYAPFLTLPADIFLSLNSGIPLSPIWAKRKFVVMHDIYPLQHYLRPKDYPGEYSRKGLIHARLAIKKAAKMSDCIIVDSHFGASEVETFLGVPANRVAVIPCGVDHERFRPGNDQGRIEEVRSRYRLPQDFYLFVGTTGSKKNFRLIVEAYAMAGTGPQDAFLPVIVAGGEKRSGADELTLSLIREAGKKNLFHFIGFVPDVDLPALYAAARALIFPSLHEGFGLPPVEAMACGTPVVASNRPPIPEVVGDAALLIDPTRADSLVEALYKVNNEAIRKELIAKGLRRAQEFSWERTARRMAERIFA
jgi:glycosyltransferase involved in cell wall biosynthesis